MGGESGPTLTTTQVTCHHVTRHNSPSPAFSPQSKAEIKSAADAYLKLSPQGDSTHGPHGPIAGWDLSRVTDMSGVFRGAVLVLYLLMTTFRSGMCRGVTG